MIDKFKYKTIERLYTSTLVFIIILVAVLTNSTDIIKDILITFTSFLTGVLFPSNYVKSLINKN